MKTLTIHFSDKHVEVSSDNITYQDLYFVSKSLLGLALQKIPQNEVLYKKILNFIK